MTPPRKNSGPTFGPRSKSCTRISPFPSKSCRPSKTQLNIRDSQGRQAQDHLRRSYADKTTLAHEEKLIARSIELAEQMGELERCELAPRGWPAENAALMLAQIRGDLRRDNISAEQRARLQALERGYAGQVAASQKKHAALKAELATITNELTTIAMRKLESE